MRSNLTSIVLHNPDFGFKLPFLVHAITKPARAIGPPSSDTDPSCKLGLRTPLGPSRQDAYRFWFALACDFGALPVPGVYYSMSFYTMRANVTIFCIYKYMPTYSGICQDGLVYASICLHDPSFELRLPLLIHTLGKPAHAVGLPFFQHRTKQQARIKSPPVPFFPGCIPLNDLSWRPYLSS